MSTWRPMTSGNDAPEPIGDTLDRLSRRLGGPPLALMRAVFGRWEELVGAQVAGHVRPVSLRGTTLIVAADAPAWATQMSFLGAGVARKINEAVGAPAVSAVEVRVRPPDAREKPRSERSG